MRFLKSICMLIVCLILLSGCLPGQEKAERIEAYPPEQSEIGDETGRKAVEVHPLEQTETQDKTDEKEYEYTEESMDLGDAFNGIHGCAVLFRPSENRYSVYNKEMAEQEVSPYSTFKVISTLIGLHNDIVKDETSTMHSPGTQYPNPEWNGDLSLQEAFQTSCIWYFRQIINEVGEEEVQRELSELKYGNGDVSQWEGSGINPYTELNGFWLGSSLKISPYEQVEVLAKIFEGETFYDTQSVETLKKIMLIQEDEEKKVYGKTGSSGNGEAWFIGFAETERQRQYFAVYLHDDLQKEQITGNSAKEIALKIIE